MPKVSVTMPTRECQKDLYKLITTHTYMYNAKLWGPLEMFIFLRESQFF